ncbi:hypothetical protein E0Z10_g6523 [Xylaria hypoxylon]|uniref:Azaphilone pigments biosynthesis cluster protein L N-terminal domain-containing protein n=1 Tax=Xylaria hypoxylon TaxID=37992 RepID=A0A4Z0YXX5_9PEZI|nr:hypothetical protein E0Z10_g6523 [Xylaria hypoxylon]
MADPLSIAGGALAVITAATNTASVICKFIRECRDARADLTQITRELSEITLILELIGDENAAATKHYLPNALQTQIQAMLTSCTTSVEQIEKILAKCRGKPGPLRWTVLEKDKATALKGSLEAFKSGLSLALETVNSSITREVKYTAEAIQDNTAEIKRDTSEILDEIHKLRNQLPSSSPLNQERPRLEQWLDNLTHYAETIAADNQADEVSDAASFPKDVEEQNKSHDDAITQPSAAIDRANDTIPDLVLRFWSLLTGELLMSLPVLREGFNDPGADVVKPRTSDTSVKFCPAKPELILADVRHCEKEVWNWKDRLRVGIAPHAQTIFTKCTKFRMRFVPQSTLIYAHDRKWLMIVDLIAPLKFWKISVSDLIGRTRGESSLDETGFEKLWFVSDCEILIVRKSPATSSRKLCLGELLCLPLPSNDRNFQGASIDKRYSPEVIKGARVTAKFYLPREAKSRYETILDDETRSLMLVNSRDYHIVGVKLKRSYITLTSVHLDTGVQLSQWHHTSTCERWGIPRPYKYAFVDSEKPISCDVVRVKDGISLGTLPICWTGVLLKSSKLAFWRHGGSGIEFAMTDVSLDELDGVAIN